MIGSFIHPTGPQGARARAGRHQEEKRRNTHRPEEFINDRNAILALSFSCLDPLPTRQRKEDEEATVLIKMQDIGNDNKIRADHSLISHPQWLRERGKEGNEWSHVQVGGTIAETFLSESSLSQPGFPHLSENLCVADTQCAKPELFTEYYNLLNRVHFCQTRAVLTESSRRITSARKSRGL